jgi:hypothetical protein
MKSSPDTVTKAVSGVVFLKTVFCILLHMMKAVKTNFQLAKCTEMEVEKNVVHVSPVLSRQLCSGPSSFHSDS